MPNNCLGKNCKDGGGFYPKCLFQWTNTNIRGISAELAIEKGGEAIVL